MMRAWMRIGLALFLTLSQSGFLCAQGTEWPCYMGDAARSGVTAEPLSFPLSAVWTYSTSSPPAPAWPEPGRELHRLDFDYAFQPVIVGNTAYFGSSADDTVRALDLADGRLEWRFLTGGPIRFAPGVHQGKIYVVSDDGYLYCLNAENGELIWKFRGAPEDRKMLGNGRMISRWPCRSGVLVLGNTVFFTAGMWPAGGIYVYALNAETGKEIWCNARSGDMYRNQPHGGASAFTGVCPQGYMLASDELLLVPSGRSTPAAYNRWTGELIYYQPYLYHKPYSPEGWENRANGGSWALIAGDVFFSPMHKGAAPDLDIYIGESPPRPGDGLVAYSLATGLRVRSLPDKDRALAFGGTLYAAGGGEIAAIDLDKWRQTGQLRENIKWSQAHERVYSLAIAGDALLVGGDRKLTAYHTATGNEVWSVAVPGQVRGMAIGNGRLVIATPEGSLLCFESSRINLPPINLEEAPTWKVAVQDREIDLAGELVEKSRISEGYALIIGEPDCSLAAAIASRTDLHVINVLLDSDKVREERERLMTTQLYGSRVVVDGLSSLSELPYASYFADLIVVTDDIGDLSGEELYRVLRPLGGVVCFPGEMRRTARNLVRKADVPREEIRKSGDWTLVVRGGLPGAGEWRYQWADGGNTGVGRESSVRPPFEILWFGGPGPDRMMPRHWQTSPPLSVGGRVFVTGQHHMIAFDAYTGRELWCRELRGCGRAGVPWRSANFVADDNSIYVTVGSSCYRLLQSTGKTLKIYNVPQAADEGTNASLPDTRSEVDVEWPKTWQIFGPFPKQGPPVPEKSLKQIPPSLEVGGGVYQSKEFTSVNGMIDFTYLYGGYGYGPLQAGETPRPYPRGEYSEDAFTPGQTAYAFARISCPSAGRLTIGAGADWFMQWYLDGKPVYDTLENGNAPKPLSITNQVFSVDVTGGEHVLAVMVKAGSRGWCLISAGGAKYLSHLNPPPEANPPRWGFVSVTDDLILGSGAESQFDESAGEASTVFAVDKKDGSLRWEYRAQRSVCNTGIAYGDGRLFLLDTSSRRRAQTATRRGVEPSPQQTLMALDLMTGEELWQTDDVPPMQYNLRYARGVVVVNANAAYDVENGDKLWQQEFTPERAPLIHGDWVIAQPIAFHLHTGQPRLTEDIMTGKERTWKFPRAYGCGHVAGCQDLLFFRSGTPGFYDFREDGTTNFGGIRPGCSVNMIPAGGLMIIPESSAACSCSYNFQTSLALLPVPEVEKPWYVFHGEMPVEQTQALRVNFGAPGDRRGADRTAWLGFPRPTMDMASPLPMHLSSDSPECYYEPSLTKEVRGTEQPWLYTSGLRGAITIRADLAPSPMAARKPYTVRMHFAEPTVTKPGERVFDVKIQDKVVLSGFDLVEETGGRLNAVVKEVRGLETDQSLTLELIPKSGKDPILSAFEVVAEAEKH